MQFSLERSSLLPCPRTIAALRPPDLRLCQAILLDQFHMVTAEMSIFPAPWALCPQTPQIPSKLAPTPRYTLLPSFPRLVHEASEVCQGAGLGLRCSWDLGPLPPPRPSVHPMEGDAQLLSPFSKTFLSAPGKPLKLEDLK